MQILISKFLKFAHTHAHTLPMQFQLNSSILMENCSWYNLNEMQKCMYSGRARGRMYV